ncbi:hypothetical protein HJC23_009268 [Cyclotella cryptica]|uniref:GAT domain-containing protein n=1 Tax=Cyclotella cryptica TaxID=29204 RepID=A0ABD3QBP8_9STRA|eukprot:CCRYP_008537-RA/>CCRYP_008537-RA protein AED:0.30 eAED:0.30 QI:0/-1/0/1/-1/1/1/0/230
MMQSDHNNSSHAASESPDQKIKQDLATLSEQITLCQSMLAQCSTPSSIDANESLLSVIGFLEACVPRMVELIEAAASGALAEETFEECLLVNDRLTNVLADVDKDPKDRTPLTPAASAASAITGGGCAHTMSGIDEEIDLGVDNLNLLESTSAVGKSAGLEDVREADPFSGGVDLLAPTPVADDVFSILDEEDSKPSAAVASGTENAEDDEDFDAFFKDRTSASQGGKQG